MRIGVVCEGQTDYFAIEHFLGSYLRSLEMEAKFIAIQPAMDNTKPVTGWSNVILWLVKNPPAARVINFFTGGLFGGEMAIEPFDAILIQMDTDILGDDGFNSFIEKVTGYVPKNPGDPPSRASEISKVVKLTAKFEELTEADVRRHVVVPAVESTETWCVAAFNAKSDNFEFLRGIDLTNAFMKALEVSEGTQAKDVYENINKDQKRRSEFCKRHAVGASRIYKNCSSFSSACDCLHALK